ncbi:DNA-3-methyladenine glycosylase [Pseudomonas sp. KSR10]|uniref:DNA-3-methyladenine glycosylase n=1 Tax=Pseudomonas sp. KSR10 TaxID=2916654 RepID=UPI001EF8C947|nr:DNA-3-methyladenine glycosylase [Pseudomonas sp. KSR10]MCG6541504.1 DNA-3-methyladenine glycosylase [Pseudomonas sp. KSR10]
MNSLTEPPIQHLDDTFFDRDAQIVAQDLLGTVIRHCVDGLWLSARIIETEAYYVDEKASHSSLGYSPSRRAMFMPAGHLYLYYSRGGDSLNFSVQGEGNAVCIKAGYPWVDSLSCEASIERMRSNSPAAAGGPRPLTRLCSGQTLLCKALGLTVTQWNAQRMDPTRLRVDDIGARPDIIQTTRLGIPAGRDEHLPYRFVDAGFAAHCTRNPLRRGQQEGQDYVLLRRELLAS